MLVSKLISLEPNGEAFADAQADFTPISHTNLAPAHAK